MCAMTPIRTLVLLLALAGALTACDDEPDEPPPPAEAPTVDAPESFTPEDDEASSDGVDLDVPVTLTPVAELDSPTAGTAGPDDALYVAARGGTVHRLDEDGDVPVVLDISDETTTDGERGLLGLAFADDGSELYLSFTDLDGNTVLDAVAVEDDEILPDERRRVLTLEQPYRNHNGGDVRIGPEGLLYLGLGDGGGAGDPVGAGQDLSTPLGSLLRIDPQAAEPYGIPDDNPFVDEEAAGEIFAYGLRNPWRFSFDRDTGRLWVADVGQDAREEINVVDLDEAAGANFGWSLMEGTLEFDGEEPEDHVAPVYEYDTRGPEGCAVTGGHVYRGQAIPELVGAYLYSDYCEGSIRALVVEGTDVVDQGDLGVGTSSTVAFAEDAEGETYVLDLEGTVARIDPGA
jgi:glucose/arabinose dehydrogenase